MRILLAGGGTAGHINPALAIAGYIRSKEPDAKIVYVGAKGGMEEKLVPDAGYKFCSINITGFSREKSFKGIMKNVKTVKNIVKSSSEAKSIIKVFKPDVCIGTGGYVCGPVIRDAINMNIPTIIHEANAYPGITNKALSKKATYTLVNVEDAVKLMDPAANCMVVGMPVRQEMTAVSKEEARASLGLDERPVILSFGGSLGARAINEAVADVMAKYVPEGRFQFIHSYGQYGTWMPDLLKEKGVDLEAHPELRISEYIYNMPECMAAADLVICRAGAMTLTELQAQGKAAILIPSPNVAENHQYHNAMALVRNDAAMILEEKDLSGESLCEKVESAFATPERVTEIGANARKMAILDANERVYQLVKELCEKQS